MDSPEQRFATFPGEDFTRCLNCLLPCCVLIEAITGGDSQKARDRMAKDPHSVCVGNCKSWKDSDDGCALYLDLKERYEKRKQ